LTTTSNPTLILTCNSSLCPDELAFRKGDILRVVDRSAVGTSGWWLCSLHGRQGVAPANRLQLLPPPAPAPGTGAPEWPGPPQAEDHARPQNIYQVPSVPRPSSSPLYERMDKIYKAPSSAPRGPGSPALRGPGSPALRHGWESTEASRVMIRCRIKAVEV
uniref:SH3 domain-containing protein n=1 Tax=Gadus morhua TaxID=8049 RepID=A0A8C5BSU0_GADMO